MIDFNQKLKESGVKAVLTKTRPKIKAYFAKHGSDKCLEERDVEFEIEKGTGSYSRDFFLYLFGGSTGYESASLLKLLSPDNTSEKWIACMGSGNWRRMEVKISDIREAVKNYQIGYEFKLL